MSRPFLPIYRELTAVTPEVEAFSREQLGGGRGEAVPYRAFPGFLEGECFWNVGEMVRRAGGEMVCGWHVRDFGGALLEAEAHAVWRQPGCGALADVTPEAGRVEGETILFVPDARMRWEEGASERIPSRFCTLCRDRRVARLVALRQEADRLERAANRGRSFGQTMLVPPGARHLYGDIEALLLDMTRSGVSG